MKTRTNLQQPQITKIIKQLESRKLIKVTLQSSTRDSARCLHAHSGATAPFEARNSHDHGTLRLQAVKSVASANRKVYMSYNVEPAREITGGAWYACCCQMLHGCLVTRM
jgi:RNA polymerase Rpc34 subunit